MLCIPAAFVSSFFSSFCEDVAKTNIVVEFADRLRLSAIVMFFSFMLHSKHCGAKFVKVSCEVVYYTCGREFIQGCYFDSLGELDLNLEVIQPKPMCAPIVPENDLGQESCCPLLPSLGKKSYAKCPKWPFWSLGCNFISPKQGNGGNRILVKHAVILSKAWHLSLVELILGWDLFQANSPRL